MRAEPVQGVVTLIAVFLLAGQTPQQQTIHSGAPYPDASLHWPAAKEYDTPPKVISAAAPVYPIDGPNRGLAVVSFTIDRQGIPQAARIKSASDPAFGPPTLAAVKKWRYKAARKDGRPVAVDIELRLPFIRKPSIGVASAEPPDPSPDSAGNRKVKALAIFAPPPEYPIQARASNLTGSGIVVLDVNSQTGFVTAGRILNSSGVKMLDNAALAAFTRWRFKPGTTAQQVKIPFNFSTHP